MRQAYNQNMPVTHRSITDDQLALAERTLAVHRAGRRLLSKIPGAGHGALELGAVQGFAVRLFRCVDEITLHVEVPATQKPVAHGEVLVVSRGGSGVGIDCPGLDASSLNQQGKSDIRTLIAKAAGVLA